MNIKTYDKTIKDLLISGRQFSIPRFQRAYSWDKKNYQEFYEDMINSITIDNDKLNIQQYFLGTMLFVGDYTDGSNQEIQIVDGQQRLTTITILFSALSDRFLQIDENVLSEQIFKYIMTKNDDGDDVRILQSKTHYPFFSFYIQDRHKKKAEKATTEEEECIEETYKFLFSALEERKIRLALKKRYGNNAVSNLSYLDILKAIRDQILTTTFVTISTNDKKQANKIFEILNAKGKKLADIDLIKNKIFDVLKQTEPADFADVKWNSIQEALNSGSDSVGIATFYRHFWSSSYKKATKNSLYDDFNKKVTPHNEKRYEEFLLDLEKASNIYMKITNPKREDYENRKEYFWLVQSLNSMANYFNVVQVRIPLLALFRAKEKEIISNKLFKETILFLENFHFTYNALLSNRANRLESVYSKFAILMYSTKSKAEVAKIIDEQLYTPLRSYLPSFDEFKNKFTKLTYSKNSNANNLVTKYAINKLNCLYSNSEVFVDEGTIEHILPEVQGDFSLNIGNLIMLESSLNLDADSLPYPDKCNIYQKSKYEWVQKFIKDNLEWEKEKIESRAMLIAEEYYKKVLQLQI